jgi:predicted ATP-dependent serine protease
MEFAGSYYQCKNCDHIIDYSDSHCPACGSQEEEELNANEVYKKANQLLTIGGFNESQKALRLLDILKIHGDL